MNNEKREEAFKGGLGVSFVFRGNLLLSAYALVNADASTT